MNETKFGTGSLGNEDDARTSNYTHSTENAHDTTLDDETKLQHDVHFSDCFL